MTDLQFEDVRKTIRAAFKNQFGFAPSANSIAVLEGATTMNTRTDVHGSS